MKKLSGGKTLAVVAVAGGALLASIAPVMADVSAQSPSQGLVRVESAKYKTFGAAVEVKVTYTCPVGAQASYLSVSLTQNVGVGVASGSGYQENLSCTGAFQTTTVNVTASGHAFLLWGKAFAKADLRAYPNANASDEREVRIDL
jgi:hypothetical protein